MLRTYKIIRVYKVPAESQKQALFTLHEAADYYRYMTVEFAVEEAPKDWWGLFKEQFFGK